MAVGLKKSVQISAYIAPQLKHEMEEIAALNRRKTLSYQVEEALREYVNKEKGGPSFNKPPQGPHGKRKRAA